MKPRLNCLPLSEDDNAIWHLVVDRFYAARPIPLYSFTGLWSGSLTQGRRDADLMLVQMELRTRLKPWANYIRWCDLNPDDDWRAQ